MHMRYRDRQGCATTGLGAAVISFQQQTTWEKVSPETWRGDLDASWAQGRATFGGVLTGAALRGMIHTVGDERIPRSIQTTFARPVHPGPASMQVRLLRQGRAVSVLQAQITQDGEICATFVGSFGHDRPSNLSIAAPRNAQITPAATSIEMPYQPGIMPAFTQHFAYRWAEGCLPFSGGTEPIAGGWCQHRMQPENTHVGIVGLLDAWPAPLLTMVDRPVPASTISWTAFFVDVPPPSQSSGWWFLRATPTHCSGGYGTTQGGLYAPDGRLAAHMSQTVVIFDA